MKTILLKKIRKHVDNKMQVTILPCRNTQGYVCLNIHYMRHKTLKTVAELKCKSNVVREYVETFTKIFILEELHLLRMKYENNIVKKTS